MKYADAYYFSKFYILCYIIRKNFQHFISLQTMFKLEICQILQCWSYFRLTADVFFFFRFNFSLISSRHPERGRKKRRKGIDRSRLEDTKKNTQKKTNRQSSFSICCKHSRLLPYNLRPVLPVLLQNNAYTNAQMEWQLCRP